MTAPPSTPLAGDLLLRVARRLLDPYSLEHLVEPAVADLQHEAASLPTVLLWRRYLACLQLMAIGLVSRRSIMRFGTRTSLGAAGFVGISGLVLLAIYLPLPHLVVAMLSAICVTPAVLLTGAVGAHWNFGRAWRTAALAAPLGYVLGGWLGWLCVPWWMASFWTTVDATMNAARYGSAFEYTAERVVLYVIYGGTLGSLAAALVSLAFLKRTAFRKPQVS